MKINFKISLLFIGLLLGSNSINCKKIINIKTTPLDDALQFVARAVEKAKLIQIKDTTLANQPNPKNKEAFEKWIKEFSKKYEDFVKSYKSLTLKENIEKTYQKVFEGQIFKTLFSKFRDNYQELQNKCNMAKDSPRIDMPVINPEQLEFVYRLLKLGYIDVNDTHSVSKFAEKVLKAKKTNIEVKDMYKNIQKMFSQDNPYPTDLLDRDIKKGEKVLANARYRSILWLHLGKLDGHPNDDKVKITKKDIPAKSLKPTQSEIWLSKLVGDILQFGDSGPTRKRIMVTTPDKDGFNWIIDGHHHYGKVALADPKLKIPVFEIDLPIEKALKVLRSIGNALGNKQQQ